jgi:glucose-1-phosphate thymidylyltransferase
MEASNFIQAIQKRQGFYVAALEEVAFRRGFIDAAQLRKLAMAMLNTDYGQYLLTLTQQTK